MQLLAELRQSIRSVPKHSAPEFEFRQSPGERLEFCVVDGLRQTGAFGLRVNLRRQEPNHQIELNGLRSKLNGPKKQGSIQRRLSRIDHVRKEKKINGSTIRKFKLYFQNMRAANVHSTDSGFATDFGCIVTGASGHLILSPSI